MQPMPLVVLALALFALALLLLAGGLIVRLAHERRSVRTLTQALEQRAAAAAATRGHGVEERASTAAGVKPALGRPSFFAQGLQQLARTGARLLDTSLGKLIVAEEDRRLLEQSGFVEAHSRGLFLMARVACAVALPLLAALLAHGQLAGPRYPLLLLLAAVAGFMLPKLYVHHRAAARREAVVEELPMLVDLLRLLQGVGLSLDQSLQVMVNDFRGVQPVLSSELEIAQRQFAAGRTREQSLHRLATSFCNEDLRAVVRLLIQVDRHGGAVQEPLKQFGDRLRETRRSLLRERIGRLTVKMTGVMIVTLLPALLIVTAGPGVLAVTKTLSALHR
ncbi:type II secretion system F family protein [Paraburkholderia hayleyella]|uniref:type II secretion system F family protein n=1 Tax=Paraburkholderia hayleyella TaxID=2152889 RepID=UPI001290C730|nr:type II secretion system F family protein [Paraburkholderia hayleyella]